MPGYELVIRNASIAGRGCCFDIGVSNGLIESVGRGLRGETEIDAGMGLVTPPFANPHLHLCKVYTFPLIGDGVVRAYQSGGMAESMEAIEKASRVKESLTEELILRNAEKAVRKAVMHGTLYIRGFADVDPVIGLKGVEALLELRRRYRGVVDIQVVAFPQDGIVRTPGTEELLWKAAEMGVDVVGGIPWIEHSVEDMRRHISIVFDIAAEHGLPVAMLTDDTGDPLLETTAMLAEEALRRKMVGRATACHARALAVKPKPYILRIAGLLRRAGVSLVTDPHTGPLHLPFRDMIKLGVNVALGQDDICDAYYPYGRNNMLEVAFLASHIAWAMTYSDMEMLLDMITWRAAKAMNIEEPRIEEGRPADLLVHAARNIHELIWRHEPPRYVVRHGRIIASNRLVTEINTG